MSETIESFVAKLQSEGVDAGKQQAEQLLADARTQADALLADARKQAEKTVAEAETESKAIFERGRTELKLASRDIVLKLRETLAAGLKAVLAGEVQHKLNDTALIGTLLHDIVIMYAKQLHEHREVMQINVPEPQREKLRTWALAEIGQQAVDGVRGTFNLHTTLKEAGFEYTLAGRTVEVTTESVTTALAELITPALRKLLDEAMQDTDEN
jgi:V/A-type H+-transporting ATPase subunit E